MLTHLQHQRPVGRGLVDRQLEQHVHGLFVRQGGQAETPTSSLSRALAQGDPTGNVTEISLPRQFCYISVRRH